MPDAPEERALLSLLGVQRTAPWEEVRRAFRDAVRASHPDLHGGDPGAEQRLKTLNGAWESVNTPAKWAQYVAGGAGRAHRRAPAAPVTVGRLRVQRQRSGATGLRRWQLELDGEVVGSIANGATELFEAGPGSHTLRTFYEWYSSRPLQVHVNIGEELHLGCRQQPNPLLSITAPKRSLILELLDRRRFV
jgi:curved DNA-binding protein CbpA